MGNGTSLSLCWAFSPKVTVHPTRDCKHWVPAMKVTSSGLDLHIPALPPGCLAHSGLPLSAGQHRAQIPSAWTACTPTPHPQDLAPCVPRAQGPESPWNVSSRPSLPSNSYRRATCSQQVSPGLRDGRPPVFKCTELPSLDSNLPWRADTEPCLLVPYRLPWEVPTRTPLDPTRPHKVSTLFFPSHSTSLKARAGASITSDGPLYTQRPDSVCGHQPRPRLHPPWTLPSTPRRANGFPREPSAGTALWVGRTCGEEGRPTAPISMATKHTRCLRSSVRNKGTLTNHRNAHTLHPEATSGSERQGNNSTEGKKMHVQRHSQRGR